MVHGHSVPCLNKSEGSSERKFQTSEYHRNKLPYMAIAEVYSESWERGGTSHLKFTVNFYDFFKEKGMCATPGSAPGWCE
jgi:hypothetical protein